ncbi:penicillin-binding protein, partial [Burkholderia pseudomallei]
QPIWEEAVIWGCEVVSHTYAARQPLYIEWLALEARYASALKRDGYIETDLL